MRDHFVDVDALEGRLASKVLDDHILHLGNAHGAARKDQFAHGGLLDSGVSECLVEKIHKRIEFAQTFKGIARDVFGEIDALE